MKRPDCQCFFRFGFQAESVSFRNVGRCFFSHFFFLCILCEFRQQKNKKLLRSAGKDDMIIIWGILTKSKYPLMKIL